MFIQTKNQEKIVVYIMTSDILIYIYIVLVFDICAKTKKHTAKKINSASFKSESSKLHSPNQNLPVITSNVSKQQKKVKKKVHKGMKEEGGKRECYKTFYWCRAHALKIDNKLKCYRNFKVCVTFQCPESKRCNSEVKNCKRYAENSQEKYDCFLIWKKCIRAYCPMNI